LIISMLNVMETIGASTALVWRFTDLTFFLDVVARPTKQSILACGLMDCFAPLAMT